MSLRPKGVTKHKKVCVPKCRITRNRLKVEKLRESLKDLHLEERNARRKMSKTSLTLHVRMNDIQKIGTRHGAIALSPCSCNEISVRRSILKRDFDSGGMPSVVKSHLGKVNFDFSHEHRVQKSKWDSAMELFESESSENDNHHIAFKSPSGASIWGSEDDGVMSSISTDIVNSSKGKYDRFVNSNSFKGTRDKIPLSPPNVKVGGEKSSYEDNRDKVEYSPTSPNSPLLYDIPPPSTFAQKKERREKRKLQLERWRKYDMSKSRQERYERRARTDENAMDSVFDSRHVQWSSNLVQTVFISDLNE